MYWANLQTAIGSTCKADKWRAGKGLGRSLVKEGKAGKCLGPCSAVAGVQEGKVVLWQCVQMCSFSVCNTWLGTRPRSFLPYLLHHWPLTKLSAVAPVGWMKREEFFLSFDTVLPLCLPFMWHILCFFIPRTVRSSSYTKPQDAHYRVPKMIGQNCGGGKSYKAAWCYLLDILGGTFSLLQVLDQNCWWLFHFWWIYAVLNVCSSVTLSPACVRPK